MNAVSLRLPIHIRVHRMKKIRLNKLRDIIMIIELTSALYGSWVVRSIDDFQRKNNENE